MHPVVTLKTGHIPHAYPPGITVTLKKGKILHVNPLVVTLKEKNKPHAHPPVRTL
jgi:hypothetical protein